MPDDMYHYGVKGMKWGVRKKDKNSQKKGSSDADSGSSDGGSSDKGPRFTKRQKQVMAVGAVAVTATLAYAGYKYVDSGNVAQLRQRDTEWNTKDKFKADYDSAFSLFANVGRDVNPGYGDAGTKNNCRRCTLSYELRRRGFDVKATKSLSGSGQDASDLDKAAGTNNAFSVKKYIKGVGEAYKTGGSEGVNDFLDGMKGNGDTSLGESMFSFKKTYNLIDAMRNSESYADDRANSIFDTLSKQPPKSRGEVGIRWGVGGAHSLAYEILGSGKPVIMDTQSGEVYESASAFMRNAAGIKDASFTRLDDKELDMDFLKKWAQG